MFALLVGLAFVRLWLQSRYDETMVEKAYGLDMQDPFDMTGRRAEQAAERRPRAGKDDPS